MKTNLRHRLLAIAKERLVKDDPSHDYYHALRVLHTAEKIAQQEKADPDIITPAALFHDLVIYPKNHPRSSDAAEESAQAVRLILTTEKTFPHYKIEAVCAAVRQCSFSKNIIPIELESRIIQDADMLDAAGAIAIMRTFASAGQMKEPFYHPEDPLAHRRTPNGLEYALDLFFTRLLKIPERVHTRTAQQIARRRTKFVQQFLKEFMLELKGE